MANPPERIDPKLRAAGWAVAQGDHDSSLPSKPTALTEFPTANGQADYAWTVNSGLVGVTEAKKLKTGTKEVLKQAERYARGLIAKQGFNTMSTVCPFYIRRTGRSSGFATFDTR